MASWGSQEVYIPRDACVRTVHLRDLPSSISKKLTACLGASEGEHSACHSSPTATWICPVELRGGARGGTAAGGMSRRAPPTLEGRVRLPVVSASLIAHRLLQEALPAHGSHSPTRLLHRGAAPVSCSKVSAGKKNAIILCEGQIFLSVRKTRNQQGRGIRDGVQRNGDGAKEDGRSEQEPIREADGLTATCHVVDKVSGQIQPHVGVVEISVQQDRPALGSELLRAVCTTRTVVMETLNGACGPSTANSSREAYEDAATEPRSPDRFPLGEEGRPHAPSNVMTCPPSITPSAHQDNSSQSSVDGAPLQLHHRVTAGPATQTRAPIQGLTSAADITNRSCVYEELEHMERISQLRAALRAKEAELHHFNTWM